MNERYYLRLAAAFVRGRVVMGDDIPIPRFLCESPLDDLSDDDLGAVMKLGLDAGLKLHKFKRTGRLARVRRVIGTIKGLGPSCLLDVGSGRGVFLWPLLDEFPGLPVTAVDKNPQRADDLLAVNLGGIIQLTSSVVDATAMQFDNNSFDVVTLLEVLEHISDAQLALAEVVRVARQFVLLSVPSKPDANPEHLHLFSERDLRDRFAELGVGKVNFDYVLNHMVVTAKVG